MKNKILLICLALLLVLPLVSSSFDTLGTFKQNQCVNLLQTCSDCTYNNITSAVYPDNSIALERVTMEKIGTEYNYTFCNTSQIGQYTIHGIGDLSGVNTNWDYWIYVTPTGTNLTTQQSLTFIIGIVVMLIVVTFFLILSYIMKHPGAKIFSMVVSVITLIIIIGIVASNASSYLADFPNLANIYNSYYIVFISLAGAAMAGLIVWLIYYSFKLFNSMRGKIPEDD
jgi:hypothetical protein